MRARVIRAKLLHLDALRGAKNLLAFSGGVDSSCLFFLLLREKIDFDLAIVNYGVRKSAKDELKYAKKLAKKYDKKIFVCESPKITRNFENEARRVRYAFFERIILAHNYENLILAHQLNDRFEWLLMQLTKGCGLNSLLGFKSIEEVDFRFLGSESQEKLCSRHCEANHRFTPLFRHCECDSIESPKQSTCQKYRVIRPMSAISRNEILAFLKKQKITFFIDKSNKKQNFKRNYFRAHFGNKLIKNFKSGILKSFEFLSADFGALYGESRVLKIEHIFLIKQKSCENNLQILANIDSVAKNLGYVISAKQRDEIVKSDFSCIVADKIIIDSNKSIIFVVAKDLSKAQKHDKKFRDKLRLAQIPPKIRPFVSESLLFSLQNALKS